MFFVFVVFYNYVHCSNNLNIYIVLRFRPDFYDNMWRIGRIRQSSQVFCRRIGVRTRTVECALRNTWSSRCVTRHCRVIIHHLHCCMVKHGNFRPRNTGILHGHWHRTERGSKIRQILYSKRKDVEILLGRLWPRSRCYRQVRKLDVKQVNCTIGRVGLVYLEGHCMKTVSVRANRR